MNLPSSVFRRRWVYEVSYASIVLGAAALILSLVGRRAGWPIGAESFNELIIVQLYAAHFRHLDFFPVWSSTDGIGLGTPVLLFYQKTFFYVSGALFVLLGGALKPTLILSIGFFLAVGAYGMRRALGMVTDSRLLQVVGSVGFLFTNYVFTDWLSRGDLPEFTAMMIVPWLLFWCLNLVKNHRVSLLLIPIMASLVDAHSAIALVSVFTLAVTMITFVITAGWRGFRAIAPRLAVSVGGAALLLAPTLLAELRFAQYYDPASKVTHFGAQVSSNFVSLTSYFFDNKFRWLSGNADFVQIDFAIWIPIVIALIGIIAYYGLTRKKPNQTPWGHDLHAPSIFFLLGSFFIYIFLQLPISYFVYRIISPLQAIDYPYRMLAFITPIGVILVIAMANSIFRAYPTSSITRAGALLWLVSLILLSPITSTWTTTYALTPAGEFPNPAFSTPPRYINHKNFGGFFTPDGILFDEYLPKVNNSKSVELYDDGDLYVRLHKDQYGAGSVSDVPCSIMVPTRSPLESLELTFRIACRGATRFALPVTFNAYSTVYVEDSKHRLRPIPYYHSETDPRVIIDIKNSKSEIVMIHLPTLWGVLK